jgi:hypothetical protein
MKFKKFSNKYKKVIEKAQLTIIGSKPELKYKLVIRLVQKPKQNVQVKTLKRVLLQSRYVSKSSLLRLNLPVNSLYKEVLRGE